MLHVTCSLERDTYGLATIRDPSKKKGGSPDGLPPKPAESEFIAETARNCVDDPVQHGLGQGAVVAFIDRDVACLVIGQDVLREVAVKGPGMGLIQCGNEGCLIGRKTGMRQCSAKRT
jgi:hypothetical protein